MDGQSFKEEFGNLPGNDMNRLDGWDINELERLLGEDEDKYELYFCVSINSFINLCHLLHHLQIVIIKIIFSFLILN